MLLLISRTLQAVKAGPYCLHAGSVVEEGLQWDIKVDNSNDIRAQRINKSLAAMLVLRSASHVLLTCSLMASSPMSQSCPLQLLTSHSCFILLTYISDLLSIAHLSNQHDCKLSIRKLLVIYILAVHAGMGEAEAMNAKL